MAQPTQNTELQRLVQAIRSHLGRIRNSSDPAARSAALQLQKELGKVKT